ncbi:MAG: hypothetical protein JXM70_24270 [Pirellulales bacterium]|nr:hypothetical protein [Pirellulales bacterium]
MPGTINGIGTWYYGKRNYRSENGICEFCGQPGRLETYETRLWCVVFFLPIIPLGRKQVIAECPSCRRHRVTSLNEWREVEKATTHEAMSRLEERPDDPESAIKFLETLTAFGRMDEAADYAKIMGEQFAHNADVQLYLGGWHTYFERIEESKSHYTKALELAPENQQVRREVIVSLVQQGNLERATQLLNSPQTQLTRDDAGLMVYFADVFASRGEHQVALGYYDTALQWDESLKQDQQLGARVRRSEKAVGCLTPRIPKKSFNKTPWLLAAVAVAILIFCLMGFNYYRKNNHTMHVVNNLAVTAKLDIDGEHVLVVPPGGHVQTSVSEGEHHAVFKCDGREDDEVSFKIDSDFAHRMTDSMVYILNVAGAADILYQRIMYSDPPREDGNSHRIIFAKKFIEFKNVDFAFKDIPKEVPLPQGKMSCMKTAISVLDCPPSSGFSLLPEGTAVDEQMRYAEHHLNLCPDDIGLLVAYRRLGYISHLEKNASQLDRCNRFLESGLERKPISIFWHQIYQNTCKLAEKDAELVAKYDDFLVDKRFQDPQEHSKFLYLRAMLEDFVPSAEKFLRMSIKEDPSNTSSLRVMSNFKFQVGDYVRAKHFAEEVRKYEKDEYPDPILWTSRFALEEYDELLSEAQDAVAAAADDFTAHANLIRILMAMGRRDKAEEAHHRFVRANERTEQEAQGAVGAANKSNGESWAVLYSKQMIHYLEGDFDAYLADLKKMHKQLECPADIASAYMTSGNSREASKTIKSMGEETYPNLLLYLYLSCRESGDQVEAESAFQKAVTQLESKEFDLGELAAILRQSSPPTLDKVLGTDIDRQTTLLMLTVLADRHPQRRGEFLDRAEKLNLRLDFPYYLIDRTIKRLRKQSATQLPTSLP